MYYKVKIELVLPVFLGCLGALFLCALFAANGPMQAAELIEPPPPAEAAPVKEKSSAETVMRFFTGASETKRNIVRELYRDADMQGRVIDFFEELCGSREIAEAILLNADAFNVSPALAFALCWEESRFYPQAVNRKNRNESVDRGLFQLNNRSFPALTAADFFNISVNARYGMSHLRHCLNSGGTETAALAMYNAGPGRVKTGGTPKVTLDYINRILENRWRIEERFRSQVRQEEEFAGGIAEAKKEPPRFARLTPLASLR